MPIKALEKKSAYTTNMCAHVDKGIVFANRCIIILKG